MLLKEDFGKDNLKKVLDRIKENFESGNEAFDETVDTINFWCDDDKDKTIFLQSDEAYATITYKDIEEQSDDDLISYIRNEFTETDTE